VSFVGQRRAGEKQRAVVAHRDLVRVHAVGDERDPTGCGIDAAHAPLRDAVGFRKESPGAARSPGQLSTNEIRRE
jgi:hypothetical protein